VTAPTLYGSKPTSIMHQSKEKRRKRGTRPLLYGTIKSRTRNKVKSTPERGEETHWKNKGKRKVGFVGGGGG